MKAWFVAGVIVFSMSPLNTFAEDNQKIHGYLVDTICAQSKAAKKPGYAANHDKKCHLMPECIKSGYSLMTADEKVFNFDASGNEQALTLIKATDRDKDWKVVVSGKINGDTIAVTSIALE